jgi:hypothetical protein
MNRIIPALVSAAILSVMSTVSQAQVCEQCGALPPPPPVSDKCKVKGNAGVGNGPDGRPTEIGDCDPGRSGLHNQAWRNIDKPRSMNR